MNLPTFAERNPWAKDLLFSPSPHQSVADSITEAGFPTSEASVRRFRNSHVPEWLRDSDTPLILDGPQVIQENLDEASEELAKTKKALNSTLKKLNDAKVKKSELVDAVYEAVSDALAGLELDPVPAPTLTGPQGAAEVAVAVLGDWQLAKVTPSYNSEVCEQRIETYGDKVLDLVNIQRQHHPVNELHVFVLGDIIEGELIFPGQHWLIDASLYRQVALDGPRILGNFLTKMLANFETVHVTAVIGNHGRLGGRASRDMDPESNGDRILYKVTEQILQNQDRLTWDIPDGARERNWYAVAEIGNYSSLLIHGDQFRGTSGLPWYSLQKKVGGWRMGAIPEHFDDVYFGHYHQPTRVTLNSVTARCVGSPESHNTYAQEQLAAVGEPSQSLMFVHPERGIVTAEYVVWLEK